MQCPVDRTIRDRVRPRSGPPATRGEEWTRGVYFLAPRSGFSGIRLFSLFSASVFLVTNLEDGQRPALRVCHAVARTGHGERDRRLPLVFVALIVSVALVAGVRGERRRVRPGSPVTLSATDPVKPCSRVIRIWYVVEPGVNISWFAGETWIAKSPGLSRPHHERRAAVCVGKLPLPVPVTVSEWLAVVVLVVAPSACSSGSPPSAPRAAAETRRPRARSPGPDARAAERAVRRQRHRVGRRAACVTVCVEGVTPRRSRARPAPARRASRPPMRRSAPLPVPVTVSEWLEAAAPTSLRQRAARARRRQRLAAAAEPQSPRARSRRPRDAGGRRRTCVRGQGHGVGRRPPCVTVCVDGATPSEKSGASGACTTSVALARVRRQRAAAGARDRQRVARGRCDGAWSRSACSSGSSPSAARCSR